METELSNPCCQYMDFVRLRDPTVVKDGVLYYLSSVNTS